jgi:tetratricopeptide (TPR) repeat protein
MLRAEPPDLRALSASQAEWVGGVCDEFEADWLRARRPSVIDFMTRADEWDDPLVRLVLLRELLTARLELGERDAIDCGIEALRASFDRPRELEAIEFILGERARTDGGRRFRPIELHAHGGLGEIFVAHDEQLGRRVALKRIKPEAADDERSRSRFIGEAEVTGQLEHPNIAPVYALGLDDQKRPFYAMRLIDGEPFGDAIARFHRMQTAGSAQGARLLSLRKLLGNMVAICNAVAFAHSHRILHRDLKPANVVLGRFGETIVVDWGLAGRLDAPSTGSSPSQAGSFERGDSRLTEHGSVLGTLPYMSPEQARSATGPLSPASDIYSLGATLYHVLTGQPPFLGERTEEMRTRVIEGNFPAPREVDRSVPGALDAIVRKAMAHDPQLRYPSATALGEDIEHWLADEPVSAWREPLSNRAARWARRHRTFAASTATVLLLGLVSLGVFVVAIGGKNSELARQRQRAVNERDRAESEAAIAIAVKQFLNDDLLAQASPHFHAQAGVEPDRDIKIRDALDRAAERIGARFAGQPLVEASIRQTIGESYLRLGLYAKALDQLERARDLRARALGKSHPDTLETVGAIGSVYLADGKLSEAEPLLVAAMDGLRMAKGPDDRQSLSAALKVAELRYAQGKAGEAEEMLLRLRDAHQRSKTDADREALEVETSLAEFYVDQQRYEEAEQSLDKCLDRMAALLGPRHPHTLAANAALGYAYYGQRRYPDATRIQIDVLKARRAVLGDTHPDTLFSIVRIGELYVVLRQYDEAEPLLKEALAGCGAALDRNHVTRETALALLAVVYSVKQQLDKVEPLLVEAVRIQRLRFGPDDPVTANAIGSLGQFCLRRQAYVTAERWFRESLCYYVRRNPNLPERFPTEQGLARCLFAGNRFAEAEALLASVHDRLERRADGWLSADIDNRRLAVNLLVQLYDAWGRKGAAEKWRNQRDALIFSQAPFAPN